MYTEGYDELSEAQNKPQRQYISSMPGQDSGRLLRENEKLKKLLEKEQFFNKLLDQEIRELKESSSASYDPNIFQKQRGVSRGSFYTLLIITLALASYIGYGLYTDKTNRVAEMPEVTSTQVPNTTVPTTSGEVSDKPVSKEEAVNKNATPDAGNAQSQTPPSTRNAKPVADSVPDIIFKDQGSAVKPLPNTTKSSASKTPDEPVATNDAPAVNSRMMNKPSSIQNNATLPTVADSGVPSANNTAGEDTQAVPSAAATPVPAIRPVIGYYQVSSKANFYSAPDENTMRRSFIDQYKGIKVGALEEKNGFIYVIYTNDLGYTIKGWLSEKDLTKVKD